MQLDGLMLTKTKFTKMINKVVIEKRMSYMDAVVYLCEQNNIEIEDVKKYITPTIREKIEAEAQRLNFLPKGAELPF